MVEAAQECGYLLDFPACIPEQQAGWLPRDKVLFICTGSQGEPRASMAKLAAGEHRDLVLEEGDTAIFSSRIIPGNERGVGRLQNALLERGVEGDHRSRRATSTSPAIPRATSWCGSINGYGRASPCRSMARSATWSSMPSWRAPARCPKRSWRPTAAWSVWRPARPRSSAMCRPAGWRGTATVLVPVDGAALRERRKLLWNGAAAATLVIDRAGRPVAPPGRLAARASRTRTGRSARPSWPASSEMLADLSASERTDNGRIEEAARQAVRRVVRAHLGKKPLTDVHIVRI